MAVKLFLSCLRWIHPHALPHRSFVFKYLDCLCGAICLFAFPKAHAGFYLFIYFPLCISQRCTFLASIGSFRSWTTSKRLKMEELGRRGPLSRASWPRWLQMVRKRETASCTAPVHDIVAVYAMVIVLVVYFPVWRESQYNVDSSHLIHIDLNFEQLCMSFHHQGAERVPISGGTNPANSLPWELKSGGRTYLVVKAALYQQPSNSSPFWEFMFASVTDPAIVQYNWKHDSDPDTGGNLQLQVKGRAGRALKCISLSHFKATLDYFFVLKWKK